MNTILLSIHKKFSDAIFSGNKHYEYRKNVPNKPVNKILVYEAKGSGKIVGELHISGILIGSPEFVWERTNENSGIDKEAFFKYYSGKEKAIAYVIGSYKRFENPELLSKYGIKTAPQNYIWINDD